MIHIFTNFLDMIVQANNFLSQGSGHELYGGFPGYGSMLLSGQSMEQVIVSQDDHDLKLSLPKMYPGDAGDRVGPQLDGSPRSHRVSRSSRPSRGSQWSWWAPWSPWSWWRWRRCSSPNRDPATILTELIPPKLHAATGENGYKLCPSDKTVHTRF